MPEHGRRRQFSLFVGIFVSAFLLIFGLIAGTLMFLPVLSSTYLATSHQPMLPVSDVRSEEIFDINANRGKQLYPALNSIEPPAAAGGAATDWIRIPAIDVNVPIVMSASMNDKDVVTTLNQGAALYPNGIVPGRPGNTFIAAHSTGEPWKGKYRFAFLRIGQLQGGNVMHIDYKGTRYTYTITGTEIVKPTSDTWLASDRPIPTLTLMACWPLWSTDKRMLVKGELTNITLLRP